MGLIVVLAVSLVPSVGASVTVYSTNICDLPKYGTTIVFATNNVFDSVYREEDGNTTYASFWFFTNNSVTYGLCPQTLDINITEIDSDSFKYTKSGVGVEKFYSAATPTTVTIDLATASTGWNYSEGIITVTDALSVVELGFTAAPTPTEDPSAGGVPSGDDPTPNPSGDGGATSPTPSPPLVGGNDATFGIIILCAGVIVALLFTSKKDTKQRRIKHGPIISNHKQPREKPIVR